MLSVAVSLLSGNLISGAKSGAKSARDFCSTLELRQIIIKINTIVLPLQFNDYYIACAVTSNNYVSRILDMLKVSSSRNIYLGSRYCQRRLGSEYLEQSQYHSDLHGKDMALALLSAAWLIHEPEQSIHRSNR
jgi:hypothetical protein